MIQIGMYKLHKCKNVSISCTVRLGVAILQNILVKYRLYYAETVLSMLSVSVEQCNK